MEVNGSLGDSMKLINDVKVCSLLYFAKEKLHHKVVNGDIAGNMIPVSRVCIDNITILMQRSKLEKEDLIKNIGHTATAVMDESIAKDNQLRIAIAKTVVEQYETMGKKISQHELKLIVDSEFDRVKKSVLHPQPHQHQQQQQQHHQQQQHQQQQQQRHQHQHHHHQQQRHHHQPQPQQLPQPVTSSSKPSSSSSDNLAALRNLNVDWSQLENAVKLVNKKSSSEPPETSSPPSQQPEQQPEQPQRNDSVIVLDDAASEGNEDNYDDLTLEELAQLFRNFKKLEKDVQKGIIAYMKIIEKNNPDRVKQLKLKIHGKN